MESGHYAVIARDTARGSENLIHDDAVARRLGFAGGLVPGVDVYAYMTHAPVARWGRDWLAHGGFSLRLARPVYDGEETVVEASGDAATMVVTALSGGRACGEGRATLRCAAPPAWRGTDWPDIPAADARPPASRETLAPGTALGAFCDGPAREGHDAYLAEVSEGLALYAEAGLVHPGYLLKRANEALSRNVRLGPWMHTASEVCNLRALGLDEPFSTRALVLTNQDRKGHLFVDIDVLIAAAGDDPVCRIRHTAIYEPRQLREEKGET